MLWCGEAKFRCNGEVNRHNIRYWSFENPHWMREVDNQWYWTVITWCGIIRNRIFLSSLSGNMYKKFLVNVLLNLILILPLEMRQRMWLQQDELMINHYLGVRNTLNQRNMLKEIPLESRLEEIPLYISHLVIQDLTCMDYYLWVALKYCMSEDQPLKKIWSTELGIL